MNNCVNYYRNGVEKEKGKTSSLLFSKKSVLADCTFMCMSVPMTYMMSLETIDSLILKKKNPPSDPPKCIQQ